MTGAEITPPTNITITGLVVGITNILPALIILVFFAIIVYGGFVRMTAAGDPEKEQLSVKIITGGVIGFLIIVLSPLIINLLGSLLSLGTLVG